ncbi:MAG: hypothetical protein H7301_03735 [Cryobacterium sp.]|nr:hypothetical protein [Oligoflexia bacterium]
MLAFIVLDFSILPLGALAEKPTPTSVCTNLLIQSQLAMEQTERLSLVAELLLNDYPVLASERVYDVAIHSFWDDLIARKNNHIDYFKEALDKAEDEKGFDHHQCGIMAKAIWRDSKKLS